MSSHAEAKKSPLAGLITYNKDIPVMPLILLGLVLAGIGAVTALIVFINGHEEMYAVNREVPWGLLIGTYAYFVITSTGLAFIGGLGHAFGFESFNKISRRIVVLATFVLLAGFTQILMEIGHPIRMIIYMMLSPNLAAPILWMGVFYSIELVILALELVIVFKAHPTAKDHKMAGILGFLALVVGTLATSNLGFVFGSLNARPWFHGIYFSTFLVISGITAGAGLLMLVHNIVYKFNIPSELNGAMKSLSKLMSGGIGMMIFLYLWKILTSLFNSPDGAYQSVMALISGPLAPHFWIGEIGLAIIVPLALLLLAKGNTKVYGLAGLVFMVGLFFTRVNFIVAGQLPVMRAANPGARVHADASGLAVYSPSAAEWGIFLLGIGTALVLYFAAEKFMDLKTPEHD
ncbi:Polysulphide reductase NrfD [Denitrovibrio acetiphilus DSM 12809]|uniref:Polysulphide reductase NrfD n=1 Tax=Denitrovibrio acetiphilus (strain DSM 12809 / NBRC 114555 / N2460) TaxID=522772 RepID=D4H8U1_DENA2|nr:NrfD/PsrC family molybdoenzyme membrane anchor subunit [Denitrovibrio acetiphilus]ADD68440.1 Polysulphide reductase NrfD [Denitrovibrio acetiphilus DSM 12809]